MRIACFFIGLFTFISCNNEDEAAVNKNASDTVVMTPKEEPVLPIIQKDTVPYNIQVDTIITLAFSPDSSSLTARGSINKQAHPVTCYLSVKKKGRLQATLLPDDPHQNIRFSTLLLPDSTSDGPFTRQLNYELKQTGTYKIIIAPNNMSEGKRPGDFLVKVKIK